MTALLSLLGNTAATFLKHSFGPGLPDDDRYVVEWFTGNIDGNLSPDGERATHDAGDRSVRLSTPSAPSVLTTALALR